MNRGNEKSIQRIDGKTKNRINESTGKRRIDGMIKR